MKTFALPAILLFYTINSFGETGSFSFTSGVDFSSGKYGQSEATDITCIPFTGKYEFDRLTLKVTIPWIQIVGSGAVTGGANNQIVIGNSNKVRTSESGLGDVITGATYSLIESPEYKFVLDVTGKVKFGTASFERGLGTGENDYTFETDAYKTFGKLTFLGTVGYRFLGNPKQINLNDVWFSSFGAGYKIDSSNSTGAYVDLRQATSSTGTNLREYTIYYVHKFNPQYKLQTYLVYGDTRSSADWGGGLMLGFSW